MISIRELSMKALSNRALSRCDHQRMQLIVQEQGNRLDVLDRTLAQRVLYGVRHGLLDIK